MRRRYLTPVYASGFTLIEVISVIVVLSIVAVLGGKFVVESTKTYQSVQNRAALINTANQAIERMSRQLRTSLPYGARITNGNSCIEFFPIASGGNYIGYVPDLLNGATAASSISVSPHNIDFGTAKFVSIGAMSVNEVYGASPASRASLASRTATQLTLSSPKAWQRNSLNQRFYLLDAPQAFCIVANQLRFYDNQDATAGSVDLTSSYSLLANDVSGTSPFALTAGIENRNVNIKFNITFASHGESLAFDNSVMIRNVP